MLQTSCPKNQTTSLRHVNIYHNTLLTVKQIGYKWQLLSLLWASSKQSAHTHTHTHTSDQLIKLSVLDRCALVFYLPLWPAVLRQKNTQAHQKQVIIYVKVTL